MIDTAYAGGHASPPLTRLGLSHWLRDALAAEMALEAEASGRPQVPVHVGLPLNDGEARSSGRPQVPVRVGLPLNDSEALVSDTPALLVSVGQSGYPLTPLNGLQPVTDPHTGIAPAGLFAVARTMAATVTVLAESAEEAMGLADAAEARLLALSHHLPPDSPATALTVEGGSGAELVQTGAAGNPKPLYRETIRLSAHGGVTWSHDTRGPLFRGVSRRE